MLEKIEKVSELINKCYMKLIKLENEKQEKSLEYLETQMGLNSLLNIENRYYNEILNDPKELVKLEDKYKYSLELENISSLLNMNISELISLRISKRIDNIKRMSFSNEFDNGYFIYDILTFDVEKRMINKMLEYLSNYVDNINFSNSLVYFKYLISFVYSDLDSNLRNNSINNEYVSIIEELNSSRIFNSVVNELFDTFSKPMIAYDRLIINKVLICVCMDFMDEDFKDRMVKEVLDRNSFKNLSKGSQNFIINSFSNYDEDNKLIL